MGIDFRGLESLTSASGGVDDDEVRGRFAGDDEGFTSSSSFSALKSWSDLSQTRGLECSPAAEQWLGDNGNAEAFSSSRPMVMQEETSERGGLEALPKPSPSPSPSPSSSPTRRQIDDW
jgi:hypothetical protein